MVTVKLDRRDFLRSAGSLAALAGLSRLVSAAAQVGAPAVAEVEHAPDTVSLSGLVKGATGHNPVYVSLWRQEGFLTAPVKKIRLASGSTSYRYSFDVPRGKWAVSAYEDRNGNGVLDMGLFGPKEPSGFWREFTGWHRPHFEEVAANVESNTEHADITLN